MKPLAIVGLFLLLLRSGVAATSLDLAGPWEFRLDPEDRGVAAGWATAAFDETVRLPGALQAQGKGFRPGPDTLWWTEPTLLTKLRPAFPFLRRYNQPDDYRITAFLLPERHYIGAAWYARSVEIPNEWAGRRIVLSLERCHWASQVWVDGRLAGAVDSLAAPHEYDLTALLTPGPHRLALRIDNRPQVDVGKRAHSTSDETAGTWNGVVGRLELRTTPVVWIDDAQVFPDVATRSVRVHGTLGNLTGHAGRGELRLDVARSDGVRVPSRAIAVTWTSDAATGFDAEVALGADAPLWDEFNPALHHLTLSLTVGAGQDTRELAFGLREFKAKGTQFTINGQTVFLRGNVDCEVFPQTAYAPMDIAAWRRLWRLYKEWGLNLARFHSWCPPEAAFAAADEVGIYLAPEVEEWSWVRTPEQEAFFRRESATMLRRFGNHPSFVMMALGNELGGEAAIFRRLITEWKKDPRRVYSIKANSPANPPEADYEIARAVTIAGKKERIRVRYQSGAMTPLNTWLQARSPQTMQDWSAGVAASAKPIITHEIGQFTSYPDVIGEPPRFTGYLKPSHLDIARDQLAERGMLDQVPEFVRASGLWQVELYKEEIESALRTRGLAGFDLLQLNDFPGQTTAPVGLLDATWTPKPYAEAARFREFCSPTVPLARMEKRVWVGDETFAASLELTHYAAQPLKDEPVDAVICDTHGREIWRRRFPARDYARGTALPIGDVSLPLASLPAPAKYTLEVSLPRNGAHNRWDFWVYPQHTPDVAPGEIHVSHAFDAAARDRLAAGDTVLLLPERNDLTGRLPMCFTTFFWTQVNLYGGQSSATGMLCNPKHPLFHDFPTEAHTNWQWWELLTRASPMILDGPGRKTPWPKSHRPLIQMIDGWKTNRKLAVLTEARVGKGRLMICTIDLEHDLATRPVARQFLACLLRYMQSAAFSPRDLVTTEAVAEVFQPHMPNTLGDRHVPVEANAAAPAHPPALLTDGDARTYWQAPRSADAPMALCVDLGAPAPVDGIRLLPRQDDSEGRIQECSVFVSDDGKAWGKPLVRRIWSDDAEEKVVSFPGSVRTRFVKLDVHSVFGTGASASAAEFDIMPSEPEDAN